MNLGEEVAAGTGLRAVGRGDAEADAGLVHGRDEVWILPDDFVYSEEGMELYNATVESMRAWVSEVGEAGGGVAYEMSATNGGIYIGRHPHRLTRTWLQHARQWSYQWRRIDENDARVHGILRAHGGTVVEPYPDPPPGALTAVGDTLAATYERGDTVWLETRVYPRSIFVSA